MEGANKAPDSTAQVLRERAYALLQVLVRTSYFGDRIPNETTLVQLTKMQRMSVADALRRLIEEGILEKETNDDGYRRIYRAEETAEGRVAFLLNSDLFASWYAIFQDYLIGFEEAMRQAHLEVIFRGQFPSLEHKLSTFEQFYQSGVRGLAFASYAEPRLRELTLRRRVPAVVMGNATIVQNDLGSVCSDNVGGATSLIQFLLNHDHKRVAIYATGVRAHDGFRQRMQGFQTALQECGLMPVRDLILNEPHHSGVASRAVLLFKSLKPRPTAIACVSDRDAFELISELERSGIHVPGDVSITGFDNHIFGAMSNPALTTVDIYSREIGRVAAHYLLNEMQQAQLPVRILLPTELMVRDTVIQHLSDTGRPGALSAKTQRIIPPEEDEILSF
jgi:LacI family transcriptional regulator